MKKDLESWELSEKEKSFLTIQELPIYNTAAAYMKHDWAEGPWGGWSRGMDMLKSIGWSMKTEKVGHRSFTTLFKPDRFNPPVDDHALHAIDGAIS